MTLTKASMHDIAFSPFPPNWYLEVLHGSHIAWKDNENHLHQKGHLFPWEKESTVPAMQHGCRAKPL